MLYAASWEFWTAARVFLLVCYGVLGVLGGFYDVLGVLGGFHGVLGGC